MTKLTKEVKMFNLFKKKQYAGVLVYATSEGIFSQAFSAEKPIRKLYDFEIGNLLTQIGESINKDKEDDDKIAVSLVNIIPVRIKQ